MSKMRISLVLLPLLMATAGLCQEMKWQWASCATSRGANRSFNGVSCGFRNILHATCNYDSLVYAGDTVICHPEIPSGSTVNSVVVTYNSDGEFVDVVDLHTIPGSMIYDTYAGGDDHENLYVTCTFSKRVFLQDTMINHCNTPFIDLPDVMIARLDKFRNINWVRTIGGTLSDDVRDLIVTGNGDIYIVSDHTATDAPPTVIDFFQQDTLITSEDLTSICKLNEDGILQWRIELEGNFSSPHLSQGKNELIYFWGSTRSDVIINNDTTITSGNPDIYMPFICCFDAEGSIFVAEFADFPVIPSELVVNSSGEYFISSYAYDTLVIGHDTIIIPPDLSYRFIGKFDHNYQPEWYNVIPNASNQQLGLFDLGTDGEDLAFCSFANHDVQLGDTLIDLPGYLTVFAGLFDRDGNLKDITISHVSIGFASSDLLIDKCGNMIVAGNLKGRIFLDNDTVSSYYAGVYDAALVKILRNEPLQIDAGPDTMACMEYTLLFPAGYQEYSLNDSMLQQNSALITETGTYVVGCATEGCWAFDTIFISIYPGFTFDIGPDASLFTGDSITFSIPAVYDSIRWFDGDNSWERIFYASNFPLGMNAIWAEVYSGPCSASDTLILEIKSDFGIDEPECKAIHVYPNPCRNELNIKSFSAIQNLAIYDCHGIRRYFRACDGSSVQASLKLESLERGIYMLHILTRDGKIFITMIILS